MARRRLSSELAGGPRGPFSPAVESGHYAFVSLQLPLGRDGRRVDGTPAEQAARALENVRLHLESAGLSLDTVVTLTLHVRRLEDVAEVEERLAGAFSPPRPACTVIAVADLPNGAMVGIEAVAVRY